MLNNLDFIYMKMCFILSQHSHAIRRKVGCLIVDYSNNIPHIISEGINGTLSGDPNVCEDKNGNTLDTVVHAEINALNKLYYFDNKDYKNITLYVTVCPCEKCAEEIVKYKNIKRVVYCLGYSKNHDILLKNGIQIEKIDFNKLNFNVDLSEINLSDELRQKGHSEEEINQFVCKKILCKL